MLILCLFLNFEPVVLCFCCKDIAVFISSNGFPRIPPKLYKTVGGIMDQCGKTSGKLSITLEKKLLFMKLSMMMLCGIYWTLRKIFVFLQTNKT